MKGLHYNAVIIDFGKSCPLHKGTFYKLPNKMESDSQYIENKIFQVSESCSDAYFFSVIIYCMWQN